MRLADRFARRNRSARSTSGSPKWCIHSRLTITRRVSGFSGEDDGPRQLQPPAAVVQTAAANRPPAPAGTAAAPHCPAGPDCHAPAPAAPSALALSTTTIARGGANGECDLVRLDFFLQLAVFVAVGPIRGTAGVSSLATSVGAFLPRSISASLAGIVRQAFSERLRQPRHQSIAHKYW